MLKRGPKMLLLITFLVLVQSFNASDVEHSVREKTSVWYRGCFQDDGDASLQSSAVPTSSSVAECASHCLVQRCQYAGVQWMDQFRCVCLNATTTLSQVNTCNSRDKDALPMGLSEGVWGVYSSVGPYLTQVDMETDRHVVMVNRPVTMEINVHRVMAMNVTDGDWKTGQVLHIQWWVKNGNQFYNQSAGDGNHMSVNSGNATLDQSGDDEYLFHNQLNSTHTTNNQYGNDTKNVSYDQSRDSTKTTYNQSGGGDNTLYNQSDIGSPRYNRSGDGSDMAYNQIRDGSDMAYNQTRDGRSTTYTQTMDIADNIDIYDQFQHTFATVGMYTIDVRVSNDISSLVTSIDLEVVYATPRDLQVGLYDDGDDDLPSCGQVGVSAEEDDTQVLAVFVNTSTHLEASVAMGPNLTFTFWFEDNEEVNVIQACDECTRVKQEHVFQKAGEFTVATTVRNSYGMAQTNITLLVLERQLSDLRIELDPTSSAIATTEDLLVFQISMVTTSRSNLSLQVWYGDGGSNVFSVKDTDSPGLVLLGDGRTLDIVANYGSSCILVVEFQYQYRKEGHYWPKVALMKNKDVVMDRSIDALSTHAFIGQTTEHGFPPMNMHESTHTIDKTLPSRGKKGEDFAMNMLDHPMIFGVYENSSNAEHAEDSGESDSYILTATLPNAVLVLSKITGLRLDGPQYGHCDREVRFVLQSPTRLNVTVTWIVYRIRDKQIDDDVQEDEVEKETIDDDNDSDQENMADGANVNVDATYDYDGIDDDKSRDSADIIKVNEDENNDRSDIGYGDEDDMDDMDVVLVVTTMSVEFRHVFAQVGVYLVKARAQNALSNETASTDIMIQCPIEGLDAICVPEYLETGSEMTCMAKVSHGSHVNVLWTIEGHETVHYLQRNRDNETSIIHHRLSYPGVYDVTVEAFNDIGNEELEVEPAVRVQDAMQEIKVYKVLWTLLGNVTEFGALYNPAQGGVNSYCNFDFDFGNGRVEGSSTTCDGEQCYMREQHRFETAGKHSVKVYGYNRVSEIVEVVDIWVVRGLDDVGVEVVGVPVAGSPVRVRLVEEGKTMVTTNVYFTWRFGENREEYITNAPTVEVVYDKPGNYVATVTATKPVVSKIFHVPIVVRPRSAVSTQLLHDLYVQPGIDVEFTIKGPLIGWSQLLVNYSDGQSANFSSVTYKWSHDFRDIGAQQVDVSLLDTQGTTIVKLTSHLVVEEPISDLHLLGPTAVAFEDYKTCLWRASMDTGSHVLYRWMLGNDTVITTIPEFETPCPIVGEYTLQLEAFNDVSPVTTTSQPIIVQYPIGYSHLRIIGNLVGMETILQVRVNAYPEFSIRIDYGDNVTAEKHFSDLDPIANITSVFEDRHVVTFKHVFAKEGKYLITGNVSNNVSQVPFWERFIPIVKVTLKTKSPWVIKTPGRVDVMATVRGGQDLMFKWNFSDKFGETPVKRDKNQTSVRVHMFGMSGEYVVSLNVTGEHYQGPGLYFTLARPITVVDPIDRLRIDVEKNYAALEGGVTRSIKFDARSSGSHVRFLFDFGDGTSMEVDGNQLPFLALDMTMLGEGRHVYTEVGEYKVKVTAVNLFGNKTAEMSGLFFVQEPPRDLHFCGGPRRGPIAAKVGVNITLCADVKEGTNVTFSWKLGDQTDIVKAGRVIPHRYKSQGKKTVFVMAKNKVRSLDAKMTVYVNHEIQGVELRPKSKVVPLDQPMLYRAVVKSIQPDKANITQGFVWKFRCSMSRLRGGWKTFKSRPNTFMYTFEKESGRCYAAVYAWNSLSNATSKTVEIQVIAKIQNLEILILSDKTERLVNRPITFGYFVYSGSDLNLTWSFGDGSEDVTTTERELEHTYNREDGYEITLTASNAFSSETVSTRLFTLEKSYCNKPTVKILNGLANKVPLSQQITLEADVKTDCNLTSNMIFGWLVDGRRPDRIINKGDQRRAHILPYGRHQRRVLILPSHILPYGTHDFQFKVKMEGTIVYSTVSTTIEVVGSPLVSRIVGGIYRQVAVLPNDTIVVDGKTSCDPDFPHGQNFSYSWTCYFMHEDGSHGDVCFRGDSVYNTTCNVSMTTAQLTIPGYCLVTADNYTFQLMVFAPGRQNGTSFQMIDVTADRKQLLSVSILQPHAPAGPANPDRKLTFQAVCDSCPSNEDLRYEWSLYHLPDDDIWNLARAHDLICVEPYGGSYLAIKEAEEEEMKNRTELEQIGTTPLPDSSQNQITTEDDKQTGGGREDETVDYDQVTRVPQPWDGQIKEGSPSRGPFWEGLPEIAENIDSGSSRRLGHSNNIPRGMGDITEGDPGDSGSSGGRQFGTDFPDINVPEGTSDRRGSSGAVPQGSGSDIKDKLPDGWEYSGPRYGKTRKLTILDRRHVRGRHVPVYLREDQTRTGLTGESLVIKPGVLQQGFTYIVQLTARTRGDGDQEGQAKSEFTVNASPMSGRCTVKPDSGFELQTEFSVHCIEWKDQLNHEPLMYQVRYGMNESTAHTRLLYRGVNNEVTFTLPAGHEEQKFKVYVYIDILDALLAKTSVCSIPLQVKPVLHAPRRSFIPESQLIYEGITSSLQPLQTSLAHGNDAMSKVYISYLAARLNRLKDSADIDQAAADSHQAATDDEQKTVGEAPPIIVNTTLATYDADNSSRAAYNIDNATQAAEAPPVIDNTTLATYDADNSSRVAYNVDNATRAGDGMDKDYDMDSRTELLKILEELPVRDEAELLQTIQALSLLTAHPEQLSLLALDKSQKILSTIRVGAQQVFRNDFPPTGEVLPLAVHATSNVVRATVALAKGANSTLEATYYQELINQCMRAVQELVMNELQFHVISEEPIRSLTDYFSIFALKHSTYDRQSIQIGESRFQFPHNMENLLGSGNQSSDWTNDHCIQSHMTSFQENPFFFESKNKVNSIVSDLSLYDCNGSPISVTNLTDEERVNIHLPNFPSKTQELETLVLKKWAMNVHQFNISAHQVNKSTSQIRGAVHMVIELEPVNKGRLFPISVLLSHRSPPSPDRYMARYEIEAGNNNLDIFLAPGAFNSKGMYFLGIVEPSYNSGRLRPGEVVQRNYTLKLWWGECLYWHTANQAWKADGCNISQHSTFKVTQCQSTHLTAFGGRFELIPNKLTLMDVEDFFSPHRNPITIALICGLLTLYILMFLWCRHADLHDNKKGGIVYLLDNAPMDQQKYEITVETGFRREAGTTAKISVILHGEEGMSETRELISEDQRPMFERNSRDKFILTLPDSIGRIWKVQIWHNNFGESPSWYLARIIVRDLNTGSHYFFMCEKWLAVEEQDGKVEREFMAQEGRIDFNKAFFMTGLEYMSDFHLWLSLIASPPYSGFHRVERLSVCLTMILMYMCLNAMWYHSTPSEYRGEFGLLDLSWRNVTVGAICCVIVIPVTMFLELLFRRSKPKHASSSQAKAEASEWDQDYPSGKPNEQESSEDSSEHVPPIMTYSLLDQSILNWPNIQTWAQKQWMRRQQSIRSNSHSGNSERSSDHLPYNQKPSIGGVESAYNRQGELDQASSGFEDCSSVIRPKASVDSTHTTAAPSVAESMRTHKPPSPLDSQTISKQVSSSDSVQSCQAPSISSTCSHKSSVSAGRKGAFTSHLYLPYWCRYIAWVLCGTISVVCITVTSMYGFRFGVTKSTLWLQSLYFSFTICVFISYPIMILIGVLITVIQYRKDPTYVDSYDIFNRQKATEDLRKWKKQMELWEEGEALERGVAARQRSRYLRFARPPQEKQLIEARKRVMKEKKALAIFRESVVFVITVILLLIIAYGKNRNSSYHLNMAVRDTFLAGEPADSLSGVTTHRDWYRWTQTSLLQAVYSLDWLDNKKHKSISNGNTYIIGHVQLRLQRIEAAACPSDLPHVISSCHGDTVAKETTMFRDLPGVSYSQGVVGNFMFGKHGVYDGSGLVMSLNKSREEAVSQLRQLETVDWLDQSTGVVFVEMTLYNAATNLFTAVCIMVEQPPTGVMNPEVKVTSTYIFRYVTAWDNFLLACELLFFISMLCTMKSQAMRIVELKGKYFTMPWNVLNLIICIVSLMFCVCYAYRFMIVSSMVESLRSTYYEEYINVAFVTFWDEVIHSAVVIVLFLSLVKCLRLLRYNKQFTVFGDVYRKARREVMIFLALFVIILCAYTSLGYMLFGSVCMTFRDLWSSLLGVSALLTHGNGYPEFQSPGMSLAANIYVFSFCVFAIGFLTAYMVAVLTHYYKSRKKRRLLAMSGQEAILFYWERFQLWSGIKKSKHEQEPVVILPPEFTMAEIEYQVDELLFRMNALTGSHGLPEKPPCYLTDSDCTYGAGDDGISSGGSEPCPPVMDAHLDVGVGGVGGGQKVDMTGDATDDRLEHRVHKIEDNLCAQEPFLAQLLKLDSLGGITENLSHDKEKQLRSHLELEIFRQLQIQRQDLKTTSGEERTSKGCNSNPSVEVESVVKGGHLSNSSKPVVVEAQTGDCHGQDLMSSEEVTRKASKAKHTKSSLTMQTLRDLITRSSQDTRDQHNDNSSSNPDSPRDKGTFIKLRKNSENMLKTRPNQQSSSSSEKISPDLSLNHTFLSETENIRKPTKPTFLHSRESSLSDAPKGSPVLKLHAAMGDRASRTDTHVAVTERLPESSSGSEQDGIHVGRKPLGRRSLRKTKSRGKGKGPDSLGPALVLDEIEWEEGEQFAGEIIEVAGEEIDPGEIIVHPIIGEGEGTEHTVLVEVHHPEEG